MSLSDLAAIGGFVSSIAVCGSLVYLALQVRQSDRNQRTLLQQGTSARSMESIWKWGEPHIAELVVRASRGETDFTAVQLHEMNSVLRATLLHFQDQFLLHNLSLINAVQLESQERVIVPTLSVPVLRALWIVSRDRYALSFSSYVDSLLKGVPLQKPSDLSARVKAALAEMDAAKSAP